ncbi:hypothetical protein AAFC00_000928 [Neodothiora populina]|uniref:Uncharacterized protein n=1 Tax=Neodothiora populina TaxID=2781224 RepID=A0ABR3PMG8_9PEZI
MPSLFSRRRASSQPPRPSAPPSASAAIAASSAFLQSSTSAASLSSAAAAAALRSHTVSPEPIGNIQTKRMIRRGSQTSNFSPDSVGGRTGGGRILTRRDSNSSMTERTFRSPSPGGRSDAVPPAADAPPVPAVPQSARRSASLEPAPLRISSPAPKRGGRNASVDRAGFGRGQTSPPATRAPMPRVTELERETSQRSINFSRPMSPGPSPGPASPTARPQSAAGWFTSPTVSNGTPRASVADKQKRPSSSLALSSPEARRVEMDVQNAADKPVTKKKKKKAVTPSEGAVLAGGTMHAGPTGTAVQSPTSPIQSTQSAPQLDSAAATPEKKKKRKVQVAVDTQVADYPPPKNPARFASPVRSDNGASPVNAAPRSVGTLQKQPSVVREDPEAESMAERGASPMRTTTNSNVSPTKDHRRIVSTSAGPAQQYLSPGGRRSASLDIPRNTIPRSGSLSPQRNRAHFSDVVVDSTSSKHQPPPRSVSPFKSALKHSPSSSIRGSSPAGRNDTRIRGSDASDTTSIASQDGASAAKNSDIRKKKKKARVSFDDGGTTVSPPVFDTSPAVSKPIRRELSPVAAHDSEGDEAMTPRPALPSFGSVRSRKTPSPDRAEKVTETISPTTSGTSPTYERGPTELTSDHALGSLVARDFADKSKESPSAPLPPQVTSVEGSGYASDSSAYSQDPSIHSEHIERLEPAPVEQNTAAAVVMTSEESTSKATTHQPSAMSRSYHDIVADVLAAPVVSSSGEIRPISSESEDSAMAVPNINVLPATPGLEDDNPVFSQHPEPNKKPHFDIPGGWEDSGSSKSDSVVPARVAPVASEEPDYEYSEADEDSSDSDELGTPGVAAERVSPNLEPIYESESDSNDNFTDANEDFDGNFASLDAVLGGSPAKSSDLDRATTTSSDLSFNDRSVSQVSAASPVAVSTANQVPNTNGDWTQATAYWSSLTKERKDQMERQAQPVDKEVKSPQQSKPKARVQPPMALPLPVTEPVQPPLESPALPRSPSEQSDSRFPVLRKSMRSPESPVTAAPTHGETHLRKSMRSPGASGGTMKASMRSPGASGGTMKTSMRPEHADARPSPQKKRASANAATAPSASSTGAAAAAVRQSAPAPIASVPVLPNDDSDSESSFKKKKRRGSVSTVDSAGRYNMKRSMRGSSVDVSADRRPLSPTPAPRGTGQLSVRSLSPNGSFMGRNRESVRTSLRGGPVDNTPTMRGKNSKAMRDSKSPTRFSMSGFSKQPARPSSSTGGRTSNLFKSRFNDSDDEDDGAPSSSMAFRSRFDDSDDEDSAVGPPRRMPANLPPVRGIPHGQDRFDDDSTDLEDSEEEVAGKTRNRKIKKSSDRVATKPGLPSQADIDAVMDIARRNVTAMNGGRPPGTLPEEPAKAEPIKKVVTVDPEPHTNGTNGTLVPTTPTKRRGLFGSMLGRRPSLPQSPSGVGSPRGKLQRKTTSRTNSNMSAMGVHQRETVTTPEQAELPRANTPGGLSTNSQNWPLPNPNKIKYENDASTRPATSDGPEAARLRTTMRGDNSKPLGDPSRPTLKRRSLSGGDIERMTASAGNGGKHVTYSEKTGKKKKFGFLRRAFGLDD